LICKCFHCHEHSRAAGLKASAKTGISAKKPVLVFELQRKLESFNSCAWKILRQPFFAFTKLAAFSLQLSHPEIKGSSGNKSGVESLLIKGRGFA